jgi:Tol biopolymer transport system component
MRKGGVLFLTIAVFLILATSISYAGTTEIVSVDSNGIQGNGHSMYPNISGDGRFISFVSVASNLVSGDTNGTGDIFVHDRQTGITERVSINNYGDEGNGYSGYYSSISADGRYVAFQSDASNLVPDDTNGYIDIFVYDRLTKTMQRVSVDSCGNQGNYYSWFPSISVLSLFLHIKGDFE